MSSSSCTEWLSVEDAVAVRRNALSGHNYTATTTATRTDRTTWFWPDTPQLEQTQPHLTGHAPTQLGAPRTPTFA